jgi:hypothetical protein
MPDTIEKQESLQPVKFSFNPLVRWFMLALATVVALYSLYFIISVIPRVPGATLFVKTLSVLVLYLSLNAIYKHLTSLNRVVIGSDKLILSFLLRRTIRIPWDQLLGMEIYKVITHYWKLDFLDEQSKRKTFRTSLAFPGIMTILILIQQRKPDLKLNPLLEQVLLYKKQKLT